VTPRYKSGHAPDISDGPGNNKRDGGSRSHNGADIDYKRKSKSELIEVYRPDSAEGSSGGWYIGEAITAVREGRKVQRAGWNGREMWVALQVPDANSKMQRPYLYMRDASGLLVPWLASQTDLLADDWQVVP
jgi:hypothetical protein